MKEYNVIKMRFRIPTIESGIRIGETLLRTQLKMMTDSIFSKADEQPYRFLGRPFDSHP